MSRRRITSGNVFSLVSAVLAATLAAGLVSCSSGNANESAGPAESEHQDAHADAAKMITTGNGNAATTTGAGATNGVGGNETPGTDSTVVAVGPGTPSNSTQPSENAH